MPAVWLFIGSALTIFSGLAHRGYTFDRSVFLLCTSKSLGFRFKVLRLAVAIEPPARIFEALFDRLL